MHCILLVGADEMLLKTRAAILSKTDSEVVTSNAASALAIQNDRECDLVVLCHSLAPEVCASLAEAIRHRWPKTRILQMVPDRAWDSVSAVVDGTSSPEPDRLLGSTIELLGRKPPMEAGDISIRGGVARGGPFA
jgi:DNA-binding response OmpR family regulator